MGPRTRLFTAGLRLQTPQRCRNLLFNHSTIRKWQSVSRISCWRVSTARGLTSPSTRQYSSQPPSPDAPRQARTLPSAILIGLLLVGGAGYYFTAAPSRPDTLNDRFFVPYTVTAREAISPSSFVITVVPHTPNPSHPYLVDAGRWRHALWSVEFKQPEVQISRHYTPLPPLNGEEPADGALRFYIRTVGDGEMSHYLSRRRVGQDVHLRGPHVGFELAERLGDKSRVVFLAGGTGVVPGLQAARAVLESNRNARVDLLWAVRNREEVQHIAPRRASSWKFWQEQRQPTELGPEIQEPSPVARHLVDMKVIYGDRLKIQVVVDEEGSKFQDKHIKDALVAVPGVSSSTAIIPSEPGCRLHDQTMHIGATEFADPEAPGCLCPSSEGSVPGKNLFIISGPDGFIEHYAGQKLWLAGHQTQGPISGVIGQLQRQEPQLAQEWLVLKM